MVLYRTVDVDVMSLPTVLFQLEVNFLFFSNQFSFDCYSENHLSRHENVLNRS